MPPKSSLCVFVTTPPKEKGRGGGGVGGDKVKSLKLKGNILNKCLKHIYPIKMFSPKFNYIKIFNSNLEI